MESWLQDLIKDDEFGLLDVKPRTQKISSNQRLVDSFKEINNFYEQNGREPQISNDILENELCYRLEGIRENVVKVKQLKDFDQFNLLPTITEEVAPKTLDDVLNDDDLGLLENDPERDIFNVQHGLKLSSNRSVGTFDYVARRVKCKDFSKYEPLLKNCQIDLKTGKRILKKFTTETSIKEGTFFVYKGVLVYIDKVGAFSKRNTRQQARVRCIFENGTESDPLRNSLAKAMYSEGQIVTENVDNMMNELKGIEKEDREAGYIYILKTLSKDPEIKAIDNLYKIGFSETKVEDRIKNARNEPTYLMAPVKIVATYKMYNVNTQKFEDLLHKFFAAACIDIDVFDNNGKRHTVREWFQVPFPIIQHAIIKLQSGEITKYYYSKKEETISEKK